MRVAEPSVAPAEPAARDAPCVGPENANISTSVPDAAAERLHALYIEELERALAPPVHPMVDERQTRALIRMAHTAGPGVRPAPGAQAVARVFFRPFATVRLADRAMMDASYDLVGVGETIICLDDVGVDHSVQAHHQRWWREAPAEKWLVLANHDVNPVNQVRPVAVDRTAATLSAPGEPPLRLTHVPLLQVPPAASTCTGHTHQKELPSRTGTST